MKYYLSIDNIQEISIEESKYSNYLKLIQYEGVIGKIEDLEILEILRKYIYYIDHTIKLKSISKSVYNFDYEKVKQWLEENENE